MFAIERKVTHSFFTIYSALVLNIHQESNQLSPRLCYNVLFENATKFTAQRCKFELTFFSFTFYHVFILHCLKSIELEHYVIQFERKLYYAIQ